MAIAFVLAKREVACEEGVDDDSDGPDIALIRIHMLIANHLGWHVHEGAD